MYIVETCVFKKKIKNLQKKSHQLHLSSKKFFYSVHQLIKLWKLFMRQKKEKFCIMNKLIVDLWNIEASVKWQIVYIYHSIWLIRIYIYWLGVSEIYLCWNGEVVDSIEFWSVYDFFVEELMKFIHSLKDRGVANRVRRIKIRLQRKLNFILKEFWIKPPTKVPP